MAKTLTPVAVVKNALQGYGDSVGKTKAGTVMIRKGYFYRHGASPESVAARVSESLKAAGVQFRIENIGDHWAAFNGGASVARSSHFYVELTVFGA